MHEQHLDTAKWLGNCLRSSLRLAEELTLRPEAVRELGVLAVNEAAHPIKLANVGTGELDFRLVAFLVTGKRAPRHARRRTSSRLNELLGEDISHYAPRSKSGKEIKIKYVTQVQAKPPVFAFFCNEPKLVDENYRRYLENRMRTHFGYVGVPLTIVFKQK